MRGRHPTIQIHLNDQTRSLFQKWMHRQKTPVGLARRARALLLLEQDQTYAATAKQVGLGECHLRKWARRFSEQGVTGLYEKPRPGRAPAFSPEVALYVVKLACERPDLAGRSLFQWDCPELAHKLKVDGVVDTISPVTIWRILHSHKLKPWRYHLWLSAKVPRDEQFAKQVREIVDLYTRTLADWEMVLCVDEKDQSPTSPSPASNASRSAWFADALGARVQTC